MVSDGKASLPIAFDCHYFLGDRPCVWHKQQGLLCTCDHYAPIRENILIIKLDAMGDVLRTTALLPGLAEAHPEGGIAWITRSESVPLLQNNPYIREVIAYGPDAFAHLLSRSFDRVINLDSGKISSSLASAARSPRRDGYFLHAHGHVVPTNPAARAWLEMGVSDELKRKNARTYQSIMAEILDLRAVDRGYVFCLTEDERTAGRAHLERIGVDLSRPLVGLNTGAGGRWELKRWRMDGFLDLIERVHVDCGAQVMLMGGNAERERNSRLREAASVTVFDAGCDNEVRHFSALTSLCDVVVTGDTLALHIALATETRTVALFGPTSAPEIELYGLGEKIVPAMDCLGCYKSSCNFVPNCMDLVSVDMVADSVSRQLDLCRNASEIVQHPVTGGPRRSLQIVQA
jgi:heptosyltransferase-2